MAPIALPFSDRPLSGWIEELQQSESAENRYRALLAVNAASKPLDAVRWCRLSLGDLDSGVRALAAKQLGEWKRRALECEAWTEVGAELADRLNDPDPDVRFEAARALGRVNPQLTSARDILVSMLDDEETLPLMTAVVVSALGERQDSEASALIPRFQKLLEHSQAEVRENVSAVVAGLGLAAAGLVTELIAALEDDEPIVRENAAIALGEAGVDSQQVLAAISMAIRDEDEGVAAAARAAQAKLQDGVPRG